jgi:hypothetical protein
MTTPFIGGLFPLGHDRCAETSKGRRGSRRGRHHAGGKPSAGASAKPAARHLQGAPVGPSPRIDPIRRQQPSRCHGALIRSGEQARQGVLAVCGDWVARQYMDAGSAQGRSSGRDDDRQLARVFEVQKARECQTGERRHQCP